jgi:hypothetical protein
MRAIYDVPGDGAAAQSDAVLRRFGELPRVVTLLG